MKKTIFSLLFIAFANICLAVGGPGVVNIADAATTTTLTVTLEDGTVLVEQEVAIPEGEHTVTTKVSTVTVTSSDQESTVSVTIPAENP